MNTTTLRPRHRSSHATADDGTTLAVHEYGSRTAPITVVFIHGHCLHSGAWQHQLRHLHRTWGHQIRMVTYDQRGHGDSGHANMNTYRVDELGRDLAAVLRHTHAGNVILVGHSMGGMAALAHIRQNPTAAGTRILGMALIATAAGDLADHGIGQALNNPTLGLARTLVERSPHAADIIRDVGKHLCRPLIHGFGYGPGTSAALRTLGTAMLTTTPVTTMVGYLDGLRHHNEYAALNHLRNIPTAVICGTDDKMTPPIHSHTLADQLAAGELTLIENAGHMVIHERPTQVNAALLRLLHRVADTAPHSETQKIAQ